MDWEAKLGWAIAEHARRLASVVDPGEREDFRLAGVAGASWAAGLASLMLGRDDDARGLLVRAAEEYRTSWDAAPPASWGRPIAMLRCRLLAGDLAGARSDAEVALGAGARDAPGPIGGYCGVLALLVLGHDADAADVTPRLVPEGLEPVAVARALEALARRDGDAFVEARARVLLSFEQRDAFLEDVRVADTVLVLDALAHARGIALPRLSSALLPP
jgi:hypothetical protein